MFARKFTEIKFPVAAMKEPFVEKPIQPLGHRAAQLSEEIKINPLQIAGLKTLKDDFVPDEHGRVAVFCHTAAGILALEQSGVVEHMKLLIHPALTLLVPPRIFVIERDAHPPVERRFQPFVAFALVAPPEQLNQLVTREPDDAVG